MTTKKTGTLCTNVTKKQSKTIQIKGGNKKLLEMSFSGGDITSDGGVLLLRQADQELKLTNAVSKILPDPRNSSFITHSWLSMIKQRIYGIALGYEDLNDHQSLRHDPAIQTAVDRERALASTSTLFRMEQKGRFFNGYYGDYCFLPLYVFCGHHLLVAYLRRSNIDGAKHAWAILSLLVKYIKKFWPNTKIIIRGDSGFCRHKMLSWCDRNEVGYYIGMAKNSSLLSLAEVYISKSEEYFSHTQNKQVVFGEVIYGAKTWDCERRIIVKAEHSEKGSNTRFVVTNSEIEAEKLYKEIYCACGDMENRIKEHQLGLFADRASCHEWWPNQLRLLFSGLAYILMSFIRSHALQDTILSSAQVDTIRLKLFKIGASIIRNTRRIRFLLSSVFPNQEIFFNALKTA